MPELPDLEVIKDNLQQVALKRKIEQVEILRPTIAKPSAEAIKSSLLGEDLVDVNRRGKYTILHLRTAGALLVHLMLLGEMDWCPQDRPLEKWTCAFLRFEGGYDLRFLDQRGWMKLYLVPPGKLASVKELKGLGPEPFDPDFTAEYLHAMLLRFPATIKYALMEQKLIAGIGNAYSDEILFCARILPSRLASSLSDRESDLLYKCILDTLRWGTEEARKRMGNSVRGEIREFLRVHGKAGQKCQRCSGHVVRIEIEGRGAYFCPNCQK